MAPRSQKAAALKVAPVEVLAAIESLYVDMVRPQGRILLKRLGERASVAHAGEAAVGAIPGLTVGSEVVPRLDTAHIRKVCERCARIQVVAEAGTEYSALLVDRAASFVDPCSNEDPFPEQLWSEMAVFFGSYQSRGVRLPGGRYACARALAAANLPFLFGRSLGELCHIVQLAVSQRRVLGYLEGHMVPYFQSEAVVKQQSAVMQQPAWSLKKDAMPVADLAEARECLREMLASSSEAGVVPLPNVKRLFRSRYQLELSETALGHSRISDLLQDARFQDICSLQLRGSTYVVVQSQAPASATGDAPAEAVEASCEEEPSSARCREEQPPCWLSHAARTFIHFKSCPVTPVRRSSSVPRNHGSCRNADSSSCCSSSPSDAASTEASDSGSLSPRRLLFCPDEPLGLEEATLEESTSSVGFPLMTPSPQYELPCYGIGSWAPRRAAAAPADCVSLSVEGGLSGVEGEGSAAISSAVAGGGAQPVAPPRRVQFCPDEPLSLEDSSPAEAETAFNLAVVTPSPHYEHPRYGCVAEALRAAQCSSSKEPCAAISLFRTLGLVEFDGIDAIAEVSESDGDSECERVPICAEPLSLEEVEEGEALDAPVSLGFPLMTPSPAYHAAASSRYTSLSFGQQPPFLGGEVRFEGLACAQRSLGLSSLHAPRMAAVGGA